MAIAIADFVVTILLPFAAINSALDAATGAARGVDFGGCGIVLWVINPLVPLVGLLLNGRDPSLGLFLIVALVGSFAYASLIGWIFGLFRPKTNSETTKKN